jgi:uncharacterized membrane protein HdeD (DUF308 family)
VWSNGEKNGHVVAGPARRDRHRVRRAGHLIWPGVTPIALALLFGAFALISGVITIVAAFRRQRDAARRTAMVISGLLGLAAGVIALVWPGITALALVVIVGAWAVVTGALEIWVATRLPGQWLPLLIGVVTMLIGILVLVRPGIGAVALALTIGIYAIVAGVLMLAESWRIHRSMTGTQHDRVAPTIVPDAPSTCTGTFTLVSSKKSSSAVQMSATGS